MAQNIPFYAIVAGVLAGAGFGLAACIREWFKGRALLIRARRGDPEQPMVIQLPSRRSDR